MNSDKDAVVFTLPGCGICGIIMEELKRNGWAVTVADLEGSDDPEVKRQLAIQNGAAPVVFLNDEPASPTAILAGLV